MVLQFRIQITLKMININSQQQQQPGLVLLGEVNYIQQAMPYYPIVNHANSQPIKI